MPSSEKWWRQPCSVFSDLPVTSLSLLRYVVCTLTKHHILLAEHHSCHGRLPHVNGWSRPMVYRFADCELDEQLYQLRRNDAPVALEPKVFDVLAYLLQHRDRVVSKDELLDKIWPGQVVGEHALTRCIQAARAAVGDNGTKQAIIETQHRRGSRFIAPITQPVPDSLFQALRTAEQVQQRRFTVRDFHLSILGETYALIGHYEEARTLLQRFLARYPDHLTAHLNLAAVYSQLGKEAEARAEAAEVLRINPKFSLKVHQERSPIKDPTMLERHIAALRKAGLK